MPMVREPSCFGAVAAVPVTWTWLDKVAAAVLPSNPGEPQITGNDRSASGSNETAMVFPLDEAATSCPPAVRAASVPSF
jgi:hypothetical protein